MRNPIYRSPAAPRGAHVVLTPLAAFFVAAVAATAASPTTAAAQGTARCSRPDSVAVRGLARVAESTALGDIGLATGTEIATPQVQGAIRRLYETKQYDDVRVSCEVDPTGTKATLVFLVKERPVLADVDVAGVEAQSQRTVRDKVDLLIGQPLDPALVARAVSRIDSVYESRGFYLARIKPESTYTSDGRVRLLFRVDEGRRLAVSGVRINGNTRLSDGEIVGAMKTKPEGFFWWRKGAFDDEQYAGDLSERIPDLYARHGYIDFQVVKDTLIVDRERGKALLDITVKEGSQYRVGSFEIVDNRRFSTEELQRYYPFTGEGPTLSARAVGIVRRRGTSDPGVFDRSRWEQATERVKGAYSNEGYIYAGIQPIVERAKVGPDSTPTVNLRWQIDERQPAIVNRIDIVGNDYTSEECIRRQLFIIPGDVFNQDRLLRSWQNIGNLNFFETPLPTPETRRTNDEGDLDLVFRVKEKRTGSVNFGASMGGAGIGVGGFIGVDQPNLFGLCKRGSLNWNFGRFINDFNLTYQDPAIRKSRVSGTVSAYRTLSRYQILGFGQNTRTGASTRIGLPMPGSYSYLTTLGISYSAEATSFGSVDPAFLIPGQCTSNCFRSNLGLDINHDTRIDLPFPSGGSLQQLTADFTGGPLGGTVSYQRYTGEFRAYAPLTSFGGKNPGSSPKRLVLGLTGRAGAVFGNPGAFFQYQSFALGGVQFGQSLRGYPEFSITPKGFDPNADNFRSSGRSSFGNAFMTLTAEVGLRFNQQFYTNIFYDAGNNFARPQEFNPTRLFRGAGLGLSVVTPLGPLGLDWAYGFDRTSFIDPNNPALGTRPDPKWQLHFKLGQLF